MPASPHFKPLKLRFNRATTLRGCKAGTEWLGSGEFLENCSGTDLTFVRSETSGTPITSGGSLRHNVDHYVRCNICRTQTSPHVEKAGR